MDTMMKLPASCSMMSEEEMSYTEGGFVTATLTNVVLVGGGVLLLGAGATAIHHFFNDKFGNGGDNYHDSVTSTGQHYNDGSVNAGQKLLDFMTSTLTHNS